MASSSPHSSDEATHHDTPSTILTVFSPEAGPGMHSAGGPHPKFPLLTINTGSTQALVQANDSEDDVFLTAPVSAQSQLSPTAAEFQPGQRGENRSISASHARVDSSGSGETAIGGVPVGSNPGQCTVSSLVATSVPEDSIYPHHKHTQSRIDAIGPIGHPAGAYIPSIHPGVLALCFEEIQFKEGAFTTDEMGTRHFMISGIHRDIQLAHFAATFNATSFNSLQALNSCQYRTNGTLYLSFTDVRDANAAQVKAGSYQYGWSVRPVTPKFLAALTRETDPELVSDYEGQLLLNVFFDSRNPEIPGVAAVDFLHRILSQFGHVKAFASTQMRQHNLREFRVEYLDTRAANLALTSLQNTRIAEFVLSTERFVPDVRSATRPREFLSLTGRSTIPMAEHNRLMEYNIIPRNGMHGRIQDTHGGPPSGNHNQVVVGRIQAGLDVRTTIMLRNIPNKIDQSALKEILDDTSRGCYDFMYLRIDFANNCNVGYAFINFTDALSIIPFALARAGQRWNTFNSDKVAEISYATIQGKDCLVQKFRNSSVMLEDPTFRPKLFVTGNGPDAGNEEKFPGPDNPSKMRRSVENAEHVGLFAPRQGQAYREEQRRRRSQFDRGTPGAQYEAYTNNLLRDPALSPVKCRPNHIQGAFPRNLYHAPGLPAPSSWPSRGF